LCPSTREEEEVIDSHNPNSLMVAELRAVYSSRSGVGIRKIPKVKKSIILGWVKLSFLAG
jgi:hypothetical protein